MSVARGFPNAGHAYSNIVKPIEIDCSFVVDPSNANGLGASSIKSNGFIKSIFMHTSATPGVVDGITNPNPANGVAIIQFKQNFNVWLGGWSVIQSPTTGSALTSVTNHTAYIITALGTTTLAQWVAAGVPAGFTPAVGTSFVAIATGAIGGTGTVAVPGASGINDIEMVGNPNTTGNNSNIAANGGAQVIVQFLGPTSSSVTTQLQTAPTALSVVQMMFAFDGSSVTVDGL
jgi:hypothetical protein